MTAPRWPNFEFGRRWIASLGVAVLVVASAACSSDDGTSLRTIASDARPDAMAAQSPVDIEAVARWGDGRAVAASIGTDATAIVTTTGVFAQLPGEALTRVGDTTGDAGRVLTALDAGAERLAIASISAIEIVTLATGESTTVELPVGVSPSQILAGPDGWLLNTSAGVMVVPPDGGAASPIESGAVASGEIATTSSGIVVPLVESNQVLVDDDSGATAVELALVPDAYVLDAKASLGGQLAVSSGVGPNPFERVDQINVVDEGTVTATIDLGELLEPSSWVVTDDAIVVASEAELRAWALDGTTIATAAHPEAQPVRSVHEIDGAVVVVHTDGSMVRWDRTSWTPEVIASGGTTMVDVDVSPDGTSLGSVDFFGRVALRPAEPGVPGRELLEFAVGEATSVAIAPDGSIGVSSSTGDAYLLDATLTELARVRPSDLAHRVGAVAFDNTSETLVTGVAQRVGDIAFDDTVVGWATDAVDEVFRFGGDEQDVAGCAFFISRIRMSPDGTEMAVSSHDFTVAIVDPVTGDELQIVTGPAAVLDVVYSTDGAELIVSYDDGSVSVRSTDGYAEQTSYQTAMGGYHAIAPLAGGTELAAADVTGEVQIIDADTGAVLRPLGPAGLRTSVLAASPDGSLVASPTTESEIVVWSSSGDEIARLTGHTGEVTGLAFSADGGLLVSSSRDGTVRTWSVDEAPTG